MIQASVFFFCFFFKKKLWPLLSWPVEVCVTFGLEVPRSPPHHYNKSLTLLLWQVPDSQTVIHSLLNKNNKYNSLNYIEQIVNVPQKVWHKLLMIHFFYLTDTLHPYSLESNQKCKWHQLSNNRKCNSSRKASTQTLSKNHFIFKTFLKRLTSQWM